MWVFDGALAAGFLVLAVAELAVRGALSAEDVVLVVLAILPVTARRSAPVPAAIAVACVLVISSRSMGWDGQPTGMFAALLATLYTLGETGRVAGAVVVVGVMWVGIGAQTDQLIPELTWSLIVMALPWGAGRAVGLHRRRTAALRDLTARLEREREAGMRLAVVQERARVAGEVHDDVAHTVAAMLAQARAAGALLDRDPARARAALAAVQDSGREAIARMRSTLGALRSAPPEWRPAEDAMQVPAPAPRAWRWPAGSDAALVVLLLAMFVVEIVWFPDPVDGSRAVSAVLAVVVVAAVALRGRAPLLALAAVFAAAVADVALGGVVQQGLAIVVAVLVTVYAVGAHPVRSRAVAGGLLALAAFAVDDVMRNGNASNAVFLFTMIGIPWAAGALACRHRERGRELADLARALEREHRANARLAVLGERTHMARELHDTVAHGVSVMVVQAAVAEHATPGDPAAARAAIEAIAATAQDALAELQRLLGLLDLDEHAPPRSPQPTLAELDELVARVRRAGLPVTLRVEGTPEPVPADVATSAYRIVQEALTNVLKHAGRPPTAVVVRYLRGALDLSVDDDGAGPATATRAPEDGGHGIVGMRERAALAGGVLEAGPRSAGGYAVHARLPLECYSPSAGSMSPLR